MSDTVLNSTVFDSAPSLIAELKKQNYLIDEATATVVYLAFHLQKPLLVEGPAGVGKTELAKSLADVLGRDLIRLQCYEGLDETRALFEWNYQKQLLFIQAHHLEQKDWETTKKTIFSKEFLIPRPLLAAFTAKHPVVLLIDEIDKSDEEFESFLLEALSDFQVTIPELGSIKADHVPLIVLTSNNTREFSDALKRRCIHLFIDYPDIETELKILRAKLPEISENLAVELVKFVQLARKQKLKKPPSIAETLDWARSLLLLKISSLTEQNTFTSLNTLVKYQKDLEIIADLLKKHQTQLQKHQGQG